MSICEEIIPLIFVMVARAMNMLTRFPQKYIDFL